MNDDKSCAFNTASWLGGCDCCQRAIAQMQLNFALSVKRQRGFKGHEDEAGRDTLSFRVLS